MSAYYNELDPYAAQWLRNLIAKGLIADGVVDNRSIVEVTSDDLKAFTQVHFFAGIGVWSHALRLAGWPDTRPVWTGSCPCQPFSVAGKGTGFADERHLWPEFFRLIRECRPAVVFGEQVASKDGLAWLDTVYSDLETANYATAAVDICAAGVGAPHIRQRLYFVAENTISVGRRGWSDGDTPRHDRQVQVEGLGSHGKLADAKCRASERYGYEMGTETQGMQGKAWEQRIRANLGHGVNTHFMADTEYDGRGGSKSDQAESSGDKSNVRLFNGGHPASERQPTSGPTNGHWRDADWLYCRDAKWRPVEPGTFPLAHGTPARVGRLRAYGNAIVPQVAQTMIESYMEARP